MGEVALGGRKCATRIWSAGFGSQLFMVYQMFTSTWSSPGTAPGVWDIKMDRQKDSGLRLPVWWGGQMNHRGLLCNVERAMLEVTCGVEHGESLFCKGEVHQTSSKAPFSSNGLQQFASMGAGSHTQKR